MANNITCKTCGATGLMWERKYDKRQGRYVCTLLEKTYYGHWLKHDCANHRGEVEINMRQRRDGKWAVGAFRNHDFVLYAEVFDTESEAGGAFTHLQELYNHELSYYSSSRA